MLQNFLLIVGNTILWSITLGIGLAILGDLTLFRSPPGVHGTGAWGSAFGVIACFLLGIIVGAVSGFVAGLSAANQSDGRPWKLTTWIGIVVGIVAGIGIRFYLGVDDREDLFDALFRQYILGTVVLIASCATVGGFASILLNWIFAGFDNRSCAVGRKRNSHSSTRKKTTTPHSD